MLRQSYPCDLKFERLIQLFGKRDEQLEVIDKILEDSSLMEEFKSDLERRYPNTYRTGRSSTPVETLWRMIVLKHLRNLSYEKTISTVNESLILRKFCRIYWQPMPHKSTLIRWSNQLSQDTLEQLNTRLTQIATQLKITRGKKLRTDGTVVATNIHFPADNNLLVDGVRVLSRLFSQAKRLLIDSRNLNSRWFRNRHRTARRLSRPIDRLSKNRDRLGHQQREKAYAQLVDVTQASLKQAEKVQLFLEELETESAQKILQLLRIFIPRIQQVIEQTRRRVLERESVPSGEKIVSLFEAHTDIICRGKLNVDVEFGHKVWLDEVDGGIISNYRILKRNPHDSQQLVPSLDTHLKTFGLPPKMVTTDRGVSSQTNETYATRLGIKKVILPVAGYRSQERIKLERKRAFKQAHYWHNGVEGRISFLKRCFGFQRCLYRGNLGFSRWVGWGVIAHNLTIMGRTLVSKTIKC